MNPTRLLGLCCTLGVAALGVFLYTERSEQEGDEREGAQADTAIYHTPFGTPTRPFSPAVQVEDLIFLSGQVGADATANGGLVPGGIGPETKQALENIKRTLEAIGSSMDKVVKCTVMLTDMKEWEAMNAVYRTYFREGRLPARSALGANGLALGARVEIECIAKA